MLSSDPTGIERARSLRKQMSYPEVLLWIELKQRTGNHKFRKQQPAGTITLDFYCEQALLCVEVDGISHDMGDQPERDVERDAWLKTMGVETLRLPAMVVLKDRPGAVDAIVAKCDERVALLNPEHPLL